jgi:hypothetical protein
MRLESSIGATVAVLGFEPVASTPQEFVQHAKVEFAKWAKVIHASHIKPQ